MTDNVRAAGEENEKKVYCPLCEHRNDDDPLYNKERQFYQKISIIKSIFGDSIDEVALAAAVLHRYNNKELAYEREFDENFDSSSYRNSWNNVRSSNGATVTDENGDVLFSIEDAKKVEANEQIDLITAAAIVMVDSNHFGKYSDVCFKDGLAGDSIVGNTGDDGSFVKFFRAFFCGSYKVFEGIVTPLDFISAFFSGDNTFVIGESTKKRFANVDKVCNDGYVGGLYNGVYKISDEVKKKQIKQEYAKQIIDFANYYKKLYGTYEEDGQSDCVSNSAGSGEYATWKQYDSKWKDVSMGSSNIGTAGCLTVSIAMQISRSGTKIGTLPNGESDFNPGAFVKSLNEHNGFLSSGDFTWSGHKTIAPNLEFSDFKDVNTSDNSKLAEVIEKELSTGYDGKYQKYIVLSIKHRTSSQHWVAVDQVSGGVVKIFDPGASGTTLDENYSDWTVVGYKVMYMSDVMQGQTGSSSSTCSGGCDLNRFIGFIAYVEGHDMCNFQGKGENTGYATDILPNDPGGQTSAFGITINDKDIADQIGYTSFSDELYSGCTEKENTEKLLIASIDYLANDWTQKQIDQIGITVNEYEKYALTSVNYGGITLAVPIMQAIKTYGKDSEEVYRAFQNSFGNMSYADGLERRRMMEYEIFMTGNYETEAAQYLGWSNMYNKAIAMSKEEALSHFPTKREELLEGMDFAPIDGSCATGSGSGELVCRDGKAVREEAEKTSAYEVCGKKNGTTKVLFVGNSRTYVSNIPEKFERIASSKGYKVQVSTALEGGKTLSELSSMFSDTISKSYDCVVMQEQTETYLYDRDTFLSGAQSVVNKVKGANSGAMTYVRATWGKNDSDRGTLDAAYANADFVASSTGSQIIPDGKSFEVSVSKNSGIGLFSDDRHQSNEGAYLSAATIFKKLYGVSVSDTSYYDSLGAEKAKKLLEVADEVVPAASSSSGLDGVVQCAKSQLGKPYVWATHGPDTFDCSGLAYYCYMQALNVDITASSAAHWDDYEHFTDVDSTDQLVPGDLIVSRGGNHVSIYIGGGEVIHASNPSLGVIQSPASSHAGPIRYKHYKG